MKLPCLALPCLALSLSLVGCGSDDDPDNLNNGFDSEICGPSNCLGCCFNGICQPGNTAAACGAHGGLCYECNTSAHVICTVEQNCGIDPDSIWKVQPTQAIIDPLKPDGQSWDDGFGNATKPDPYVLLSCDSSTWNGISDYTHQTPVVDDNFNPTWSSGGCSVKAGVLKQKGFIFRIMDEDLLQDEAISSANLIYALKDMDFAAGSVEIQPNDFERIVTGFESITFELSWIE